MLVLTRKLQEQIVIGGNIKVTVLRVKGNTVRIGIEAPRQVRVVRSELPPEASAVEQELEIETTCDLELQTGTSLSMGRIPAAGREQSNIVTNSVSNRGTALLPRCPAPLAAFLTTTMVANGS